jgi:hypothetical protein
MVCDGGGVAINIVGCPKKPKDEKENVRFNQSYLHLLSFFPSSFLVGRKR